MRKRKKIILIHATAFVMIMLVAQFFFYRGPVRTLTQDDFSKQPNFTTLANTSKPFQYTIDDYTMSMKLPEATEVHVSPDRGDNLRFSLFFVNSKLAFRGYVQVWKVKDLEHFLSESKSLSPFDFKAYSLSKVQENNYKGLKTEWTAGFGQNISSGKEYWLNLNSEEVVRVSFFTDTDEFPVELKIMTQQILNSFEINKSN